MQQRETEFRHSGKGLRPSRPTRHPPFLSLPEISRDAPGTIPPATALNRTPPGAGPDRTEPDGDPTADRTAAGTQRPIAARTHPAWRPTSRPTTPRTPPPDPVTSVTDPPPTSTNTSDQTTQPPDSTPPPDAAERRARPGRQPAVGRQNKRAERSGHGLATNQDGDQAQQQRGAASGDAGGDGKQPGPADRAAGATRGATRPPAPAPGHITPGQTRITPPCCTPTHHQATGHPATQHHHQKKAGPDNDIPVHSIECRHGMCQSRFPRLQTRSPTTGGQSPVHAPERGTS
ncbi:hypothetical protein ABH930_007269 [Kitasatospora sp. GAS204A]|nr:hypothetical protein [Kitasatospora sp. GAS204B]